MKHKLTKRQADALRILAAHPNREWSAGMFAAHFWPGKEWLSGGSRYDASSRHGGRMLHSLVRRGLVDSHALDRHGYAVTYSLSEEGKAALAEAEAVPA